MAVTFSVGFWRAFAKCHVMEKYGLRSTVLAYAYSLFCWEKQACSEARNHVSSRIFIFQIHLAKRWNQWKLMNCTGGKVTRKCSSLSNEKAALSLYLQWGNVCLSLRQVNKSHAGHIMCLHLCAAGSCPGDIVLQAKSRCWGIEVGFWLRLIMSHKKL